MTERLTPKARCTASIKRICARRSVSPRRANTKPREALPSPIAIVSSRAAAINHSRTRVRSSIGLSTARSPATRMATRRTSPSCERARGRGVSLLSTTWSARGSTLDSRDPWRCPLARPADPGVIRGRDWKQLARDVEASPRYVLGRVESLLERASESFEYAAAETEQALGRVSLLPQIRRRIRKNTRSLEARLSE